MQSYQIDTPNPIQQSLATMDALARLQPVILRQNDDSATLYIAAEALNNALLSQLQSSAQTGIDILITQTRAQAIGIKANDSVTRITAGDLNCEAINAIAQPGTKTPAMLTQKNISDGDALMINCAKQASLLPALICIQVHPKAFTHLAHITTAALEAFAHNDDYDVQEITRAALPLKAHPNTIIQCFRNHSSRAVHLALSVGTPDKDAPLVRIHSSCLTGDILGSLRCDCGDQLHLALESMQAAGGGILLYLHQEGRGIGITNKLRAYQLQQQGIDTYEANKQLGFEDDERDFGIASAILKTLNATNIKLMTNNPHKLAHIEKHGITVTQRIPLIAKGSQHSQPYLDAKAKKSGHLF